MSPHYVRCFYSLPMFVASHTRFDTPRSHTHTFSMPRAHTFLCPAHALARLLSPQALTQDVAFLIESVRDSAVVEISEDNCFLRPKESPLNWPLEGTTTPLNTTAPSKFNPNVPEFVPSFRTTAPAAPTGTSDCLAFMSRNASHADSISEQCVIVLIPGWINACFHHTCH